MLLALALLHIAANNAVPFAPVTIHVSPNGDDGNDGSAQAPLLTLGGAQNMARRYSASTSVTIEFQDGFYSLNRTQLLTENDSGAAGTPRVYTAAPGAKVSFGADVPMSGWRAVKASDAAWPHLNGDARASVMVAPLPPRMIKAPQMLFDAAAEDAAPEDRAFRRLPNANAVSSLVPIARQDSETCRYLGQFKSEAGCRAAALEQDGLWAYAWHNPSIIGGDFAAGCYARIDAHGGRIFPSQDGVMSAVFAPSVGWREVTDWDISASVSTQHRCDGAECEYFDAAKPKSTMRVRMHQLGQAVGNDATSLSLRIYLVDFAMNVLPIASIHDDDANSSTVTTAYPGSLLLGQRPGYCNQAYDEGKCTPAVWLLNTMHFEMPGQFAVSAYERAVYYWPALASKDTSRISVPSTSALLSLEASAAHRPSDGPAIEHVSFIGLKFMHGDFISKHESDAGGIQHDWARLQSRNSLVTLSGASHITFRSCAFLTSGGGGVRSDGFAKQVSIVNSTFDKLGFEAAGVFGLGLGTTHVTSGNVIESNDISRTGLIKMDSPALVLWNSAYTRVTSNYIHDTSTRALYLGGSRYCSKPPGFATDGGIRMNQWDEMTDANVPSEWLKQCADPSYSPAQFAADCKCSFFRYAHGTVIRDNIFARVAAHKDRPFFSDGLVYVSGPGYEQTDADATVFEGNTWIASPNGSPPAFRFLYVDGYTGSMSIRRNAVVDGNARQGFNVCNWYGRAHVEANALQLGDASWGPTFDINCDGYPSPSFESTANLVLSDETSKAHQPDAHFLEEYAHVFRMVCAASRRAAAPADGFLEALNGVIAALGGPTQTC